MTLLFQDLLLDGLAEESGSSKLCMTFSYEWKIQKRILWDMRMHNKLKFVFAEFRNVLL